MVTAKKPSAKKAVKAAPTKVVKKSSTVKLKSVVAKKSAAKKAASNKVDYYPNRMTFWVSAAAGSIIVLIAVILAYNR